MEGQAVSSTDCAPEWGNDSSEARRDADLSGWQEDATWLARNIDQFGEGDPRVDFGNVREHQRIWDQSIKERFGA